MNEGYDAFLATKRENVKAVGFDVEESAMTPSTRATCSHLRRR